MPSKKHKINFLGPIVYSSEKSSNETIFENCGNGVEGSRVQNMQSSPHLIFYSSNFYILHVRTHAEI